MEIEDKYLNSTNCKDNDIIVFIDAGSKDVIDNKFKPGTKKTIYNFTIEKEGKQFVFSPNSTSLKNLIRSWGKNTDTWIGKKASIRLALTTSGNYAIMVSSLEQKI